MPNCHITPTEIKAAMPDGLRTYTTKYDGLLMRLAGMISQHVDRRCRRVFSPWYGARSFNGSGDEQLWVPDLLALVSVELSQDAGATYTALAATDYIATVGGDYNDRRAYTMLVLDDNGDYSDWNKGQRSVRITGWWGYADDRDAAWEDTGLVLAGNYTAGGTTLSVADASLKDTWGIETALHAGRLARVDDEAFEVTGITGGGTGNDSVVVVGARNGTTAANHSTSDRVSIWRAPEPVRQACIIQAVRQLERGLQGFGDARATPETGELFFIKALDPEAEGLLRGGYVREGVG